MKNKLKRLKNTINYLYLSLASFLLPVDAFAAGKDPTAIVDKFVKWLQGGFARSVAILAIVVIGYLCIAKQRLPKESLFFLLLGLGLVFGGGSLYTTWVG